MPRNKAVPEFQVASWAEADSAGNLKIQPGPRPYKMVNSDASGAPLVKWKNFGADIIRFGAGEEVGLHTHIGDHILLVVKGEGRLEYSSDEHSLIAGQCYLIPGGIEHAISATTELILVAVGNDHREVGSEQRLTRVVK